MAVLLIAEHNNKELKPFTLNAVTAASQIDADVLGNNPIYQNDKVVGRATGGEYGFRLDKSIALAMVKPDVATVGEKLKVDILGKMYDATVLDESPYDPENNLLRA